MDSDFTKYFKDNLNEIIINRLIDRRITCFQEGHDKPYENTGRCSRCLHLLGSGFQRNENDLLERIVLYRKINNLI